MPRCKLVSFGAEASELISLLSPLGQGKGNSQLSSDAYDSHVFQELGL